jgi:adenylylsulfate kinase
MTRPRSDRLAEGATVWLTGLPSSGKSTLAAGLADRLRACGYRVEVLDGDVMRAELTRDLGFTRQDRIENVRRIGFVASLLSRNGVVVLCPVIAPYREARDHVRATNEGRFFEVYVSTPLAVCEQRDVKGLYARSRAGELHGLTGHDDPYEAPVAADVVVPAHEQTVEESVAHVWEALRAWSVT